MSAPRKTLPCKYFYDQAGSRLFDEICELEEYYPTRTETGILRQHAVSIASLWPEGTALIEYGSGSSIKTRILLAEAHRLAAYVPVDISCEHLHKSARDLANDHPGLVIVPVCADYTWDFPLPEEARRAAHRSVFFPGSTIGNFTPSEAVRFLSRIRRVVGAGGSLLIGVDLVKDERILRAAYNDARGITARFNLNLLARINRELDGDFDLSSFEHVADYEPRSGRIVMRLVSRRAQFVSIGNTIVTFRAGESITTEYSYKYTLERFAAVAARASFCVDRVWTDPSRLFSVQLLRARRVRGNDGEARPRTA
jgi:dimethylhistidine N-methyltransferase